MYTFAVFGLVTLLVESSAGGPFPAELVCIHTQCLPLGFWIDCPSLWCAFLCSSDSRICIHTLCLRLGFWIDPSLAFLCNSDSRILIRSCWSSSLDFAPYSKSLTSDVVDYYSVDIWGRGGSSTLRACSKVDDHTLSKHERFLASPSSLSVLVLSKNRMEDPAGRSSRVSSRLCHELRMEA
jgi:hypothetical protein